MRPRKCLIKLQATAIKKVYRLKCLLSSISHPKDAPELYIANTTIETLNTWSNFSRSFYLSCALHSKAVNGNRITTTSRAANFNDAIGYAMQCCKPKVTLNSSGIWARREEPAWHDPNTLIRICTEIQCSNITNICDGLSGGQTFFSDLPTFRNFYAHRNQETELAAMNKAPRYSISATLKPSAILREFPIGETSILLVKWLNELEFTIEYLCYE